MAAPAIFVSGDTRRATGSAWVINRTTDLSYLIGGALLSYAMIGSHIYLGVPAVVLYMVWVLAIDGPHVFATLSRTYLDAGERAARSKLLTWSLWFFALGPVAVGASVLAGTRLPYDAFLMFCSLWAYWHVARQHYGVMVLYKKKASDLERTDNRIDSAFIYVGLLAPFLSFVLTNARTLAMLGLEAPPPWAEHVAFVSWALVPTVLLVLAVRQLAVARSGASPNYTKLVFMTAAVSVSAVLFSPYVVARMQYEAVFPIVTSFHDVQYLAIVWFYHQNRQAPPSSQARTRRHPTSAPASAAPLFASSLAMFLGAGVVFTIVYRVLLGCVFSAWPGCDIGTQHMDLPAGLTVSDLGVGFLWGFALHHYYLDQKIWRVRHDAALSRDLQLETAA